MRNSRVWPDQRQRARIPGLSQPIHNALPGHCQVGCKMVMRAVVSIFRLAFRQMQITVEDGDREIVENRPMVQEVTPHSPLGVSGDLHTANSQIAAARSLGAEGVCDALKN